MAEDHPARIIDAFVDGLDRASLQASYLGVGSLAYDPDLMLKIVLYEAHQGHLSPARWARDIRDSDALRWLGQGIQPSRSAFYNFRDRLSEPVFEMHAQAIQRAISEGLTSAENGVLDGTSTRACASRHQLVNEDKLAKRLQELNTAVAKDAVGQSIESQSRWMAKTPNGRLAQVERYRVAGDELAKRLAKNEERPKDKRLPRKKVKVSITDPEAPLGRDKEKVFGPMYTTEFVVDTASLLILSFDVFAQVTDAGTLTPMLDRTKERCFADTKKHRNLRCLHGRGLKRAKAEIGLVVLVQTALTLARLQKNDVNSCENAA